MTASPAAPLGNPPAVRAAPILVATGIRKHFGAVAANRDASLEVDRGEIHAVVGENGAGKSTLMRILAGNHEPDGGRVEFDGRDVTGWSTRDAIAAGVGMVHQHFMLVPTLTVAENLVLGREPRRGARFDRVAAVRAVESLGRETGLVVESTRLVADLSVGEAQRVEVLKVLWRGARVLILDEPTAVLSPPEVQQLWAILRRLKASGSTIVLITHKLDEVMAIADVVTVMRAGETVGRLTTAAASPSTLARLMVGREVTLATASGSGRTRQPRAAGGLLEVDRLVVRTSGRTAVREVSLSVAPGEILGIAGVEGNGQTELIEAIAGLRPVSSGSVRLGNVDLTHATVRQRAESGLSHVPEDRHRRGLVLEYSVADNLILGHQHGYTRRGGIDRGRVAANAARQMEEFDVRPRDAKRPARTLSGGNQQKVVIAREMGRDFSVLLAAQPTRGVDVGAIEFIHDRLRKAADDGNAILLVSADLVEILALSHRVAVMYDGRLVAALPRSEATVDVIGRFMTGVQPDPGQRGNPS
jgi:simple sugar transport system ATP-binding protein